MKNIKGPIPHFQTATGQPGLFQLLVQIDQDLVDVTLDLLMREPPSLAHARCGCQTIP